MVNKCHNVTCYIITLFQYLDKLFTEDPHVGKDFHAQQVRLYAEYDPSRLLPFLRSSVYYPLQGALDECTQRNLIPEMVYLLGMCRLCDFPKLQ